MVTAETHADTTRNADRQHAGSRVSSTEWQQFADKRITCTSAPERPTTRRMRRVISHEQGRALETIGHAVDYLNDCHLSQGSDDEIVNAVCPVREAVQILISLHLQLLHSLPLVEPLPHRIWNSILHRQPGQTPRVIPWSLR